MTLCQALYYVIRVGLIANIYLYIEQPLQLCYGKRFSLDLLVLTNILCVLILDASIIIIYAEITDRL